MAFSAALIDMPSRSVAPLHLSTHHRSAPALHPPAADVKLCLALPGKPSGAMHGLPAEAAAGALVPAAAVQQQHFETLDVLPGERIRDIKMRLRNRSWFSSSRQCIVFGDQQLADSVRVSDMLSNMPAAAAAAEPDAPASVGASASSGGSSSSGAAGGGGFSSDYMHVFVRLADVQEVSVRTLLREVTLSMPLVTVPADAPGAAATPGAPALSSPAPAAAAVEVPVPPPVAPAPLQQQQPVARSALTVELANSPSPPPSPIMEQMDQLALVAPPALSVDTGARARAVVHLMVHKSAKFSWRHTGSADDQFELSISSSETVDSLLRRLEHAKVGGVDADSHRVVYGGQVLASGRPLAAYGIQKGSVLELVPLEGEPAQDAAAAPVTAACDGAQRGQARQQQQQQQERSVLPDGSPRLTSPAHGLHREWVAARAGLAEGVSPRLAPAGTGGSYFMQDKHGNSVAVFKPQDEEPYALNNPKGRTGAAAAAEGLRRGTRAGEGAVREVAAYVLDHERFSGVPPTALVAVDTAAPGLGAPAERKVGSLQQFVVAEGDCEELGGSWPVREVHKVAVLDIRLANTDRNGGNILARRRSSGSAGSAGSAVAAALAADDSATAAAVGGAASLSRAASSSSSSSSLSVLSPSGGGADWELVPIDHGYVLPASFEDISFEWLWWRQAEVPFSSDPEVASYIARLDVERDIAALRAHRLPLRPECLRVLRVCTALLKKGAARGLSPYQIGCIMSRVTPSVKSPLEKLHVAALQAAASTPDGSAPTAPVSFGDMSAAQEVRYLGAMERLLDEYLEEFVLEGDDMLF